MAVAATIAARIAPRSILYATLRRSICERYSASVALEQLISEGGAMRTMNPRPRKQAPQQPHPPLTRRESAKVAAASASITPEHHPRMSNAALAFARQMRANPHVQAAMRDLADK